MKFSTSRMMTTTFAAALVFASSVSAHSWIWCTDYRTQVPGQSPPMGKNETDPARRVYDATLCEGFPPNMDSMYTNGQPTNPLDSSLFGTHDGYDQRPSLPAEICGTRPNTYQDRAPMATYAAGEIITVVYPPKNHVAAATTSRWIEDGGVNVYIAPPGSPVTSTNFPSAATFGYPNRPLEHFNGVHVNSQIDYLGFQRCPRFDENNDKATCTMDFRVPANTPPGVNSFAWLWEFNTGQYYSTCWSAMVTAANGPGPNPTQPTQRPPPPTTRQTTTRRPTTTRRITNPPPTNTRQPSTCSINNPFVPTNGQRPTTRQPGTRPPVVTVPGAECSLNARAACTKGLTPPRGTCMVTDQNDPTNGYVCQCAPGYETPGNPRTCNLEGGVRVRIVLNVIHSQITDSEAFMSEVKKELSSRLNVEEERISMIISEGTDGDEVGLTVLYVTVAGASNPNQVSSRQFFDQLGANSGVLNSIGRTVSIRCMDCPVDSLTTGNSASSVLPSLAVLVVAAASSLLH